MSPRPPAPRRLLALIALVVLIAAVVPAVSAETIYDNELVYHEDTSLIGTTGAATGDEYYGGEFKNIRLTEIDKKRELSYIILDVPYENANTVTSILPDGEHDLTYTLGNGNAKPCKVYVQQYKNALNQITRIRFTIFFDEWDIGDKTGTQTIILSQWLWKGRSKGNAPSSPVVVYSSHKASPLYVRGGFDYVVTSWVSWKNHLTVLKDERGFYDVSLIRNFNNIYYGSQIDYTYNGLLVGSDTNTINHHAIYAVNEIDRINISAVGQVYSVPLVSAGSDESPPVTVYVRNSQTGSLLANAHIEIQDTTTDPWTEVVNQTLPSGTGTFSLPIDAGLHFTQYHIGATVPGYQQVVPALFARVTGPTNIVVEMEPTAGGPEDPNNAYLEFYVRDIHANGIPNANVLVDGKTRWTNGHGYTQFEVAKNATYPYTVSKSGYMTIRGSAIVADGPRYVANVVLGPGTVPTNPPTLGPGETPGATPTPDTRTNEQKGQAIIDLVADFAEPIAILAILATIFGLMQMMTPRRRR